jgi:hypothetical protein
MERPLVTPPILEQIHPKDRISLHRPERHSLLRLLIAIHKLAPLLIPRRVQQREIRPAARQIARLHVRKERRCPVPACIWRDCLEWKPVGVVVESLLLRVGHELERLEVCPGEIETLET